MPFALRMWAKDKLCVTVMAQMGQPQRGGEISDPGARGGGTSEAAGRGDVGSRTELGALVTAEVAALAKRRKKKKRCTCVILHSGCKCSPSGLPPLVTPGEEQEVRVSPAAGMEKGHESWAVELPAGLKPTAPPWCRVWLQRGACSEPPKSLLPLEELFSYCGGRKRQWWCVTSIWSGLWR